MQILIESSDYKHENHGDSAMLQVAVTRFQELCPTATIYVTTLNAERLHELCPKVHPLNAAHGTKWDLLPRIHLFRNKDLSRRWWILEKQLRRKFPLTTQRWLNWRWQKDSAPPEIGPFLQVVEQTDLFVAQGGGYVSDWFVKTSTGILDTLEEGLIRGKPAVMVGAGIDLVTNWVLATKAKAIFHKLAFIGVREAIRSPNILRSMGAQNITVTGDDAFELAYEARSPNIGHGIGVNVRDTTYANVPQTVFANMANVLHDLSQEFNAPLLPIPINMSRDLQAIEKALRTHVNNSPNSLRTPRDVMNLVSKCRVVITGSYHAAVFALAQGIPTVALANTPYYFHKFEGLAHLFDAFGTGCVVLPLDNPRFAEHLKEAVRTAWNSAELVRPLLLEKTHQYIDTGRSFYRRIIECVQS
jgi:polysaccharide pyruvyl transferase WcaK-like protein